MEEMNEQNPVEEPTRMAGPGARLREARESRKLTVEQAATQLRMQARIIEALESDDYSGLPGNTFVQGYLRSYSRLLGLPEENIIGLSHSADLKEPELISSISGGKVEVSSRDLPFRLVSFLVLMLIVIGLGWWFSQREPLIETEAPQLLSPGDEQGLSLPLVTEPQSEAEEVAEVAEDQRETESAAATAVTADEAVQEEAPVTESQPAEEPVQAAQPAQAEVTPPELTSMTPQSKLELEFQADCWSEISDAAGRQLLYGLIPAGRHLTLHGEAPFKVFFGYASGVTVYYNGDLYDHTPFQRGDVARFRLGRAEHNRPLSGN